MTSYVTVGDAIVGKMYRLLHVAFVRPGEMRASLERASPIICVGKQTFLSPVGLITITDPRRHVYDWDSFCCDT